MRKILAGLLIGLGVGAVIGLNANKHLLGWAVVVAASGAALLIVRGRGSTGDLSVAGLGPAVENILRLAEEQAGDLRRRAEEDAARTIADAHAEADRIRRGA